MKIITRKITAQEQVNRGIKKAIYINPATPVLLMLSFVMFFVNMIHIGKQS